MVIKVKVKEEKVKVKPIASKVKEVKLENGKNSVSDLEQEVSSSEEQQEFNFTVGAGRFDAAVLPINLEESISPDSPSDLDSSQSPVSSSARETERTQNVRPYVAESYQQMESRYNLSSAESGVVQRSTILGSADSPATQRPVFENPDLAFRNSETRREDHYEARTASSDLSVKRRNLWEE